MPSSRPNAKQRALRALAEGARVTLDLLADASGRSLQALKKQAEREGWAHARRPSTDAAERVQAIAAQALERVETLCSALLANENIDKARFDALTAAIRALDRIAEILRTGGVARESQIKRNEDLAEVLGRINERIVELATRMAAEMVADQSLLDDEPGRPAGRRAGMA